MPLLAGDALPGTLLALGPILFLAAFAAVSVVLGARGVAPAVIPGEVAARMPQILLGVLTVLGASLWFVRTDVAAAWHPLPAPGRPHMVTAVGTGVLTGVCLALLYLRVLVRALDWLQRTAGDIVPPGSVLPALSSRAGVFFVANVLLAPVVEETLYRGVGLAWLTAHAGAGLGRVLSCAAFGLLHWPGGIWYVLLTGGVAGGAFVGLQSWSGGLLAPFAAHLALNAVEFAYARSAAGRAVSVAADREASR